MTELIITPKTQGFLSEIIKIHFPSGHEWTASAVVSAFVQMNTGPGHGGILSVNGFVFDTDFGAIYPVSAWPNPFLIPVNFETGPNIGIDSWGQNIVNNVSYWFVVSATVSVSKAVLSANPSVSVNANFSISSVAAGENVNVHASATGATSGRPGGDATQSAFSNKINSVVTVVGSASASLHNVTASVSAN